MDWKLPNLRRTWLIYRRELTDAMRDRRTLFMMLVLPVIMYPAVVLGGLQFAGISRETERKNTYGLMVCNLPIEQVREVLAERKRRNQERQIQREAEAKAHGLPPPTPDDDPLEQLRIVAGPSSPAEQEALIRLFETEGTLTVSAEPESSEMVTIHALVIPEPRLAEYLRPDPPPPPPADGPRLLVRCVYNGREARSLAAAQIANELMRIFRYRQFELGIQKVDTQKRLDIWLRTFHFQEENCQPNTGFLARQFVGTLSLVLVIMALTGAFYPAIDVVAGEKERGTMETLLITPATRLETVLGKFGVVWSFSVTSAVMNLASLGITFWYVIELAARDNLLPGGIKTDEFSLSPLTLLLVLVMLVPLAALFSGMTLALSTLARSAREGQYYLSPVFLLAMPLALPASVPETNLTPFRAQVPVMGLTLALKDMLLAGSPADFNWPLILSALLATVVYASLAIWWSVRMFGREDVLFREAEDFRPVLWLQSVLARPRHLPREGDVYVLFGGCLTGFWFIGAGLNLLIGEPITAAWVTQLCVLLVPTLGYAGVLAYTGGLSLSATFQWRPTWFAILLPAVPLAAAAALVLVQAFAQLVQDAGWLPVPTQAQDAMKNLVTAPSLAVALLVFAVVPAVCEELICRGFLLSGLLGSGTSPARAVVASAVMFGLLHYLGTPLQVAYAALLGLLLGWMVYRTGNLLFGVLFHVSFNGLSAILSRSGESLPTELAEALAPSNVLTVIAAVAVLAGFVGLVHWQTNSPTESAGTDSLQAASNKADSTKADSLQADSNKADSNKAASLQADSTKAEAPPSAEPTNPDIATLPSPRSATQGEPNP